ncbi:MAG: hypothetical protein WC861_07075 [Candidatus Micrarchaeia archaeon]
MKIHQAPDPGKRGSARMQREERLWDQLEACEKRFPDLDRELRGFFLLYRKGPQYRNMPLEHRAVMDGLNKRYETEFHGRLPLSSSDLAADCQKTKAKQEPACPPYDKEMAAIVKSDVVAFSTEINNYWTKLLVNYGAFQSGNKRAPSKDAESDDEKRLAYGYDCCFQLARQGKLPLETEIMIKKLLPDISIVDIWKQKLEMRGCILGETGKIPSVFNRSQSNLAYWLYTVSNLVADGRLPQEAGWLSSNFKPICELQEYLALAKAIGGEENIRPDLGINEATRPSAWREEMRALHAEGGLSQYVIAQIKGNTKILGD